MDGSGDTDGDGNGNGDNNGLGSRPLTSVMLKALLGTRTTKGRWSRDKTKCLI